MRKNVSYNHHRLKNCVRWAGSFVLCMLLAVTMTVTMMPLAGLPGDAVYADPQPSAAPTGLQVQRLEADQAYLLTWDAPEDPSAIDHYSIETPDGSEGGWTEYGTTSPRSNAFVLQSDAKQVRLVAAYDTYRGETDPVSLENLPAVSAAEGYPSAVTPTAQAGNQMVTVRWSTAQSDASLPALYFEILRADDSGNLNYQTIAYVAAGDGVTEYSYEDAGLTNGKEYSYQVRACNAKGYDSSLNHVPSCEATPTDGTQTGGGDGTGGDGTDDGTSGTGGTNTSGTSGTNTSGTAAVTSSTAAPGKTITAAQYTAFLKKHCSCQKPEAKDDYVSIVVKTDNSKGSLLTDKDILSNRLTVTVNRGSKKYTAAWRYEEATASQFVFTTKKIGKLSKGETITITYTLKPQGSAGVKVPSKVTWTSGKITVGAASTNAKYARRAVSSVTLSKTAFTFNNKNNKPTPKAKYKKTAIPSDAISYTASYKNSRSVGTGSATFTFTGDYKGKFTKKFKVNPKGTSLVSVSPAKKAMTVKWKKQAGKMPNARITGYQIQCSTSKSFKSGNKTFKVKGFKATSKKISKLKAKKKYYVRVRTYRVKNGVTYYSVWSKSKGVTTK